MAGKHATMTQIKQAIALREVGATQSVIAHEVGLSISTVTRICTRFDARRGGVSYAVIEKIKLELLANIGSDQTIKQAVTLQIADDLESTRIIRDKIIEAVNKLPVNSEQAANSLRALNSAASALASAQKVGRVATGCDVEGAITQIPTVLEIRTMTDKDIAELKEGLKASETAYGKDGDDDLMTD